MRTTLETQAGIEWVIGAAAAVLVEGGRVIGLRLEDGRVVRCRALVVTTGTFLNGLIHIGPEQRAAGRLDEPAARELSASHQRFLDEPAG